MGAQVEQFLPKADANTRSVSFPACQVGARVYQTISIANSSDTPMIFNWPQTELKTFRVKPETGMVGPNSFQLFVFEFSPHDLTPQSAIFQCVLNNSPPNSLKFEVAGVGHKPAVELSNDSRLFFKPLCQGVVARSKYTIANVSRIPVKFQWRIPEKFLHVLRVFPTEGILQGNETFTTTWEFAPDAIKPYYVRVPCAFAPLETVGAPPAEGADPAPQPEQVLTLHVRGECTTGMVAFEPSNLDWGTLLIDKPHRSVITLRNLSECTEQCRNCGGGVFCLSTTVFKMFDFLLLLLFQVRCTTPCTFCRCATRTRRGRPCWTLKAACTASWQHGPRNPSP